LQGAAIVIATRDVEAAAAFAQTAVLLEAGRVRWQGPPRTIADDPALLAALLANREGAQ
jgi:ABC-type branched-subunit amino acid transport system ATPase component